MRAKVEFRFSNHQRPNELHLGAKCMRIIHILFWFVVVVVDVTSLLRAHTLAICVYLYTLNVGMRFCGLVSSKVCVS